jgi:ribosomal protein S18 acetylase RimI-like enzyme
MTSRIQSFDHLPDAARIVDDGIDEFNSSAAPLHEVKPLCAIAYGDDGQTVIGGAVGRTWGRCAELQQLWVEASHRGQGVATRLMTAFEQQAQARGCVDIYLETFNFQAPDFYRKLGYTVVNELAVYPHGIKKSLMSKRLMAT